MTNPKDSNIGESDYSTRKIQPWDVWESFNPTPWEADIIKRLMRTKSAEDDELDLQKIRHVCEYKMMELDSDVNQPWISVDEVVNEYKHLSTARLALLKDILFSLRLGNSNTHDLFSDVLDALDEHGK